MKVSLHSSTSVQHLQNLAIHSLLVWLASACQATALLFSLLMFSGRCSEFTLGCGIHARLHHDADNHVGELISVLSVAISFESAVKSQSTLMITSFWKCGGV